MQHKALLFLFFIPLVMDAFAQYEPILSISVDDSPIIHSIDISHDGKYILTGSRKPILWNAETGEKIRAFNGHDEFDSATSFSIGVLSVDISSDFSTIVSGDNRLNIVVSRFNDGMPIFKIKSTNLDPSGGGIVGVAVMPDNKRVLSANGNGTMEMWDIESGQLIKRYRNRGHISSIILFTDGKRVIYDSGTTVIVDLETDENIHAFTGSSTSISSDEKILQIIGPNETNDGGAILHYNIDTFEKISEFPLDASRFENAIDISPDANNFLLGNSIRENVTTNVSNRVLYDAITPSVIRAYTANADVDSNSPYSTDNIIKFFPDGRKFLTVNGNTVHIWDISDVVTSVEDAHLHRY